MNHRPSPAIHAYMVGAGTKRLAEERDAWIAQYFDLLASGFAYSSIKVALKLLFNRLTQHIVEQTLHFLEIFSIVYEILVPSC